MKTKSECRKYIIEQAKKYFNQKREIYVIGQKQEDIDYIYRLLVNSSLSGKFIKGSSKKFLNDLGIAQIMLLQDEISGILYADRASVTAFEKNLRLEKYKNLCFEVPYDFFRLAEAEAEERIIECFAPMTSNGRINDIQFDITDKCNLNCALCSHFSPLVKVENRYSVEQFTKDAWRLRELTEHVECIDLWGGEALLHPQLDKMIEISREVFPESRVAVGTNGILIPTISDDFLDTVKKNAGMIRISGYPPTIKMLDKIEKRLVEKGIKYTVTPVDKFFKRYELPGENNASARHAGCTSKICHVVKNGTYSSCYVPYGAKVFNEYFGDKFSVNASIFDLYDENLDMISFTEKVKGELDICRFCGDIELHSWKTVGKEKDDISSWVNIRRQETESDE